ISCSMVGLRDAIAKKRTKEKEEAGFPPPLWSPWCSAGSTGTGGRDVIHRLFGRDFRHREYRHESAAIGFRTKLDATLDLGEQSVVCAHADIKAGMPSGAALTGDNVTGNHVFATERLDAKTLAGRISTVTR